MAIITAASVSQSDVLTALGLATNGDTVLIPPGSATWTTVNGIIYLGNGITLQGSGVDITNITIGSNSATYTTGIINFVGANAVAKDFTVNGATSNKSVFIGSANYFRISNIKYNGVNGEGYFCYGNGAYGLIDNCIITGGGGTSELIFARGPGDSWQTNSSLGGPDAIYVEDCIFNGPGYVCDFNSNSRGVIRYCTVNGKMKVDGHGAASNSPPRGVRHMEVYGNLWTNGAELYWTAIEMRGGSGHVFNNKTLGPGWAHWFKIREYGVLGSWGAFGGVIQTLYNYPILDQIGVGKDPKASGSEPMYLWNNIDYTLADWPFTWDNIPQSGIDLYRTQIGDPNATYTIFDIIQADRDYFKHTVGATFNGSSGVGYGTKAQMQAITPTKNKVGFWVTDEGNWNQTPGGAQGRLYTWNGSAWTQYYEPYTYPHPLRGSPVQTLRRKRMGKHLKFKVFGT